MYTKVNNTGLKKSASRTALPTFYSLTNNTTHYLLLTPLSVVIFAISALRAPDTLHYCFLLAVCMFLYTLL